MAGRITASESQLRPDPRYNDKLLSKFVNVLMYDGKKTAALRVIYDALDHIQAKLEKETDPNKPASAIEVFHMAIDNVKPNVEVRSKRVGGANYQVPMPVNNRRQLSLAMRWLRDAARSEGGRPMHQRMGDELYAAAKREGKAMATREQTHRMADANKAFAHFAW